MLLDPAEPVPCVNGIGIGLYDDVSPGGIGASLPCVYDSFFGTGYHAYAVIAGDSIRFICRRVIDDNNLVLSPAVLGSEGIEAVMNVFFLVERWNYNTDHPEVEIYHPQVCLSTFKMIINEVYVNFMHYP